MKIQKNYPEEFIGRYRKKYKLVKVYKYYGLYITETGYKTCFNLETIGRELVYKRDC
jgi:hypothetical protein